MRALNAFQHLPGRCLHHGLFVEVAAENQSRHFLEIFIGAITVEQETTHPVTDQLIMTVRILLKRFLRLGKIAFTTFLH